MINAIITGSSHYIPENVIKNSHFLDYDFFDEAGNRIDKTNEEIVKKFEEITEIQERRYVDNDMLNSQMAAEAGRRALEDAGVDKNDLDYVMVATNYGDIDNEHKMVDIMPSISARVKHNLEIKNNLCKPYDMNFGCPGWIEATILASQLIKAGIAKKILVIGSETLSRATDPHDRTAMIFADGAGAIVLEAEESDKEAGVLNHLTISDNLEEMEYLLNGPSLNSEYNGAFSSVSMKGRKVYEYALRKVPSAMKRVVDNAGISAGDIDKILLHQANAKMDHAMVNRFYKLYNMEEPENVAPMTVQTLGNTSVATVPTMYDLVKKGKLGSHKFKENSYVIMASVGAGMNINAFLYKFP